MTHSRVVIPQLAAPDVSDLRIDASPRTTAASSALGTVCLAAISKNPSSATILSDTNPQSFRGARRGLGFPHQHPRSSDSPNTGIAAFLAPRPVCAQGPFAAAASMLNWKPPRSSTILGLGRHTTPFGVDGIPHPSEGHDTPAPEAMRITCVFRRGFGHKHYSTNNALVGRPAHDGAIPIAVLQSILGTAAQVAAPSCVPNAPAASCAPAWLCAVPGAGRGAA